MKILRIFMLTLLVSLCIAVAVGILVHLYNSDNGNARRGVNGDDSEMLESSNGTPLNKGPVEDGWLLQGALARPEGSELWHYYPTIPEDAEPGTTIVLSASALGFVDWETDPEFADVEFFDYINEEDFVYVSFVLPDAQVMIRALYEDMYISNANLIPREYGEFPDLQTPLIQLGDVNGDGIVNLADLALLSKYLRGENISINAEAADINSDGKITVEDLDLLASFFAHPGPIG